MSQKSLKKKQKSMLEIENKTKPQFSCQSIIGSCAIAISLNLKTICAIIV